MKLIPFSWRTTGMPKTFFLTPSVSLSLSLFHLFLHSFVFFPSIFEQLNWSRFYCQATGESKEMLMVVCLVLLLLFGFRLWKAHFIWCFFSEGLLRKPTWYGVTEGQQYQEAIYPTKKKGEEQMVKWTMLTCLQGFRKFRYVVQGKIMLCSIL